MAAVKVAPRRELGSFSSQQAQIQGQDAARAANGANRRLDEQLLLVLAAPFKTTVVVLNPTKLAFPAKKGDLWFIEYWGLGRCSSVNGMNYGLFVPPNSVVSGTLETSTTNVSVANWTITQFLQTSLAPIGTAHVGANDNGRPDRLQARVQCGADGNIAITAASVTAATTTTIEAQAILRATKYIKVLP